MARTKKPNRNPMPLGQSKLQEGTSWTDPRMTQHIQSCVEGSKLLCAAILRTGKLHRKMEPWEQVEARRYAYGPDLVDKGTRK